MGFFGVSGYTAGRIGHEIAHGGLGCDWTVCGFALTAHHLFWEGVCGGVQHLLMSTYAKKAVRFEVRMGKGGLLTWRIPVFIADVYLVISNVCFHISIDKLDVFWETDGADRFLV